MWKYFFYAGCAILLIAGFVSMFSQTIAIFIVYVSFAVWAIALILWIIENAKK